MRSFTKAFLMLLLCTLSALTTQAKTEKVHATFENPSNTNTSWNAETKTFTWSTTYYNQLRNIGLPNGDVTKYKKLVVDCTIKSGDQFRILIYKGGSNLTLYAKDGVNEFILADTLKALYPNDYNEYLLACDEICLSGNNAAAPGEAVINDMYLETYDDEGEKVYATFENPSNTNTTWNSETNTFTWSTTYYNQLRNIGLPSGDITKYKKLIVDCEIKSGDQFRVLIYKGGSNLTLYAKNGVNEFILADTLKALYPNDYNEYLLACDEICLSGNNAAAPGEAVINAVYLETYPENESVEIPEIQYEEDPGKPEGDFVDFTEVFSTLQPRIGLGEDTHPIVLGNGDVVVGQRTKDVIADLSAYSKLTMVTSPNLKLVVYMNHEVDAQQNAGDYAPADSSKYVFLNVQANENGIAEVDLTQFAKQDLNCICLPWDNNNKGTVWYLLLTAKAAVDPDADTLPIDIQFGTAYNDKSVQNYTSTWTATKDGKTWSLVNFNNNQNGWNSVKCGRKDYTSVASIASPAINAAVKSYVITLDAVSNVNTAKLAIMNGENLVGDSIDITEKFVAGEVVVPVEGQKGYSYVLTIDNKSGKNGSVEISRILLAGATVEPVEPVHIANTAETAYTIAKAIELIDAGEALNDSVFVKGIICQVDTFIEKYKSISYWISEDGTTNGAQFECYSGKDINGADFASIDDVKVGAEVIVTGLLTKYKDIYEFKAGNNLVAYKAPVAPVELFAGETGKYYLCNVASEKFWGAGNSWGTQASLLKNPDFVTLIQQPDGTYQLESQVSNGGNAYYFNGSYMDNGSPVALTIAKIAEPISYKDEAETIPVYAYTISTGEKYYGWNGTNTILADNLTADSENAAWLIVSEAELLATLPEATIDDPIDATFLIIDHTFGRNHRNVAAWTNEGGAALTGGNSDKHSAEKFHGAFNVFQKLANAPVGVYKFTAQGFYRQDGSDEDNLPVFYANDVTTKFPVKTGSENSMADGCASFEAGNYAAEPIFVQVTEAGELTVGAKLENNNNLWCMWDNFELTYYGTEATIDQVKNAAIIAELEDLRVKAAEMEEKVEVEAVKNAVQDALTTTAEVGNDAESINAAIATLKAAIEKADVHIAAKVALDGMANVMAGTNVYTAEAFETYNGIYETAKGKYQAGELTKADVIENPEAQMGWHSANSVDDLLLSAWTIGETQCKDYDAGMYINTWSVEGNNDGSNFKVPFFEYWVADANSLAENTLTATMSNLPEGKYDVTAWVRVRIKNDAEAPATGITLSVNEGEAVDVAAGDQVGTSQMYLKEFTATGEVGADGVLKIQFKVAADNNISWLSFKNVKFEKQVIEVAHTWSFTKWSDATVANLKAEAAKGYTEGLWSDSEKADGSASTMEISKDNCFWQVGTSAAEGETLTANGEEIAELKGLIFKNNKARSLAIAVNYGDCTSANGEGFGPYHGASYLWLGSKNIEYFTIKSVKAGTQIKMGVESHKFTEARGVQLFAGETVLTDPEGAAVAAPTTYTEQTWAVPGEEGVVDVVVKNTNGCHIYYIDAEISEPEPVDSALIAAKDALLAIIAADKTIATENQQGAEALATAITTAETAANAADATVESIAAARAALASAVATFVKANIGDDFAEIAQDQGKTLDTFTRTELVEGDDYNTYTAADNLNIAIKMVDVDVKYCDYLVVKFAEPVAAGWHLAFWSGQDLVDVTANSTEYKYVFAEDAKCGISAEGVLPQICMMTFFGGFQAPLEAKIVGIYKHYTEEYMTSINTVKTNNLNGVIFNLNGQKMNKAQKGLFIINGKKVVIK